MHTVLRRRRVHKPLCGGAVNGKSFTVTVIRRGMKKRGPTYDVGPQ